MFFVKQLKISKEKADNIRRTFKKSINTGEMNQFLKLLNDSCLTGQEKWEIKKVLSRMKFYGLCKSHSISLARLICMLYYRNYYYPKIFWKGIIMSI